MNTDNYEFIFIHMLLLGDFLTLKCGLINWSERTGPDGDFLGGGPKHIVKITFVLYHSVFQWPPNIHSIFKYIICKNIL